MSLWRWFTEGRAVKEALKEARETRRENRGSLTQAVTTLDNDKNQLKELMAAMLERRGGHDA